METLTISKMWHHLRTIQTHRKWVRRYCRMAGIPWRGITHDLSKYSPIEFFESARYWTGTRSPVDACKEENGVSLAWLHHKGRNTHHYEYWIDNFSKGGEPLLMPLKDFTEQVCDFLGAGRAYNPQGFTYSREYEWWKNNRDKKKMHEKNKMMLDLIFFELSITENPNRIPTDIPFIRDWIPTPEKYLKSGRIEEVYNHLLFLD